jgi:hypothetical protein
MPRINAATIAKSIDRPGSDWTDETLHRAFLKFGCAVVREIIPRNTLDDVRSVVETAYAKTDGLHVHDPEILETSGGRFNGFELVSSVPLLSALLQRVYVGQNWRPESVTARRIQGSVHDQSWQQPIHLHLDSEIHGLNFTTYFWIPFQDCGVDSPTLQLLPVDYRKSRAYSGYTGKLLRAGERWNLGYFSRSLIEPAPVTAKFGQDCFLRPILHPGDIIIASNWIIHGSHRTPSMTKGRANIEVRFIGSSMDIKTSEHSPMKTIMSRLFGAAAS